MGSLLDTPRSIHSAIRAERNTGVQTMPLKVILTGIPKGPKSVPDAVRFKAQSQRIERMREILHWSNKEMAHRAGVGASTLSKYARGRGRISINTEDVWKIARITGTEANYIISGETKYLNTLWHQRLKKKH
jgi:DNA-binding XRE family transcriptional regulator